jgi:hypothetical protein
LTVEERKRIGVKLAELRDAIAPAAGERADKGAIIARMLMAYPVGNLSEEVGVARAGAYLDALDDVPAWAIGDAVKRWNRGEAGDGMNYSFAPAPAILRKLALRSVEPVRVSIASLEALAAAGTIDEAMAGNPAETSALVPRLKSV